VREREGGTYSRGRNITKVSAASQFARSKRALVSVLEPAKKPARRLQEEEEKQIKIACTFRPLPTLRPRVFTLEGKTKD